jgi:hypothetical protein
MGKLSRYPRTTMQMNHCCKTSIGRTFVMATRRKFKSDAFEAIHSSATALQKIGAIDKTTMKSFDESCLAPPRALRPAELSDCGFDAV